MGFCSLPTVAPVAETAGAWMDIGSAPVDWPQKTIMIKKNIGGPVAVDAAAHPWGRYRQNA